MTAGAAPDDNLGAFAGLLERLYAAVLEPDLWSPTLEEIARRFMAAEAGLTVGQVGARELSLEVRWLAERDPSDTGSVTSLRHRNAGLGMLAAFEGDDGRRVQIELRRGPSDDSFLPTDREFLHRLIPHIGRAALLTDTMMRVTRRSAQAEILLDSLSAAVLIVDDRLNVLHLNQAAKVLLASQNAIFTQGSQLMMASRERNLSLQLAILAATDQSRRQVLSLQDAVSGKPPQLATIVPLLGKPSRPTPGLPDAGAVAVIVGTALESRGTALDIAARIYDLTPSEREVMSLVAEGLEPASIAMRLDVTVSTVRTHLHRLFDKTCTSRQPDLIRLLHRFLPP